MMAGKDEAELERLAKKLLNTKPKPRDKVAGKGEKKSKPKDSG